MPVRIERCDRVLTVIHSRAEVRNAVDPDHADALQDAFVAFDTDEGADVAVFWGEGGAFCAGADLKSLANRGIATPEDASTHRSLEFPKDGGPVPRGPMGPSRLTLSKPVIAAIEGPAVAGGMELALWADCRIMADGAYMGVYNRRWGVPLTDGGTVRLPRLVGQGRALELIMTGRRVDADECLRIGLCEMVVPKGQARQAAEDMAREITRFPQELYAPIGAPFICSTTYPSTPRWSANGTTAVAFSMRRVPLASRGSLREPGGIEIMQASYSRTSDLELDLDFALDIVALRPTPKVISALVDTLVEAVASGASVSFMHPLAPEVASAFWTKSLTAVEAGERVVLGAMEGDELAGTVTLHLDTPQNQPHRGEIAKLMTRVRRRGRGIARADDRGREHRP